MGTDREYKAALRWVNAQRAYRDLPTLDALPPWRGCIDPIEAAMAPLRCRVSHDHVWLAEFPGRKLLPLPPLVQRFVEKLDQGHYDSILAPAAESCPRELHVARCASSVTSRLRAA